MTLRIHLKFLSHRFGENSDCQRQQFNICALNWRGYVSEKSFPLEIQVLMCLHLLGTWSFQHVIADSFQFPSSQATVSRHLEHFVNGVLMLRRKFIEFPNSASELNARKLTFNRLPSLPNIVGAIDCTHIQIKKPPVTDWFVYLNRKSNFSINVQLVCDYNLLILDAVVRWPGSTHDSFIWKNSGLRHCFVSSNDMQKNFLVGDSGYPLEPWLLVPYDNCETEAETLFNEQHRKARNCIERCNGVLKSRFRCLHKTGGCLGYSAQKICKIIMVCIILHNICVLQNVDCPESLNIDEDESTHRPTLNGNEQELRGRASSLRDEIAFNLLRTFDQ